MNHAELKGHERVFLVSHGDVAVLRIDNPPVNATSPAVISGMDEAVRAFEQDLSARALVISCAGGTFVAGGDITVFEQPDFSATPFNRILGRIEALERPVVAALHGTVLGAGLELALACHWRVAAESTQFGFPEVKIGLLPGSLGTQRLPRLVGVEGALDLISTGRSIGIAAALEVGVIDAVLPSPIEDAAMAFARDLLARGAGPRRLSERSVRIEHLPTGFFASARAKARNDHAAYPAAAAVVEAVEASILPFAEGEAVEARLFETLLWHRLLGGQRPSMGDYVTGTGATRGAPAAGGR